MAIYALLDVDQTLINTEATFLNEALLDSLKKRGITDLVLFTTMYSSQIGLDIANPKPYARESLILELEKRGFTVHKVITPMDVLIGKPGAYYEEHWKPAYNNAKAIGQAGAEVEKIDTELENILGNRSKHKGDMYTLAVNHLTELPKEGAEEPTSFLYSDDKEEERENVKKAAAKINGGPPLTIMPIPTRVGLTEALNIAKQTTLDSDWKKMDPAQRREAAQKYLGPGDVPIGESEMKSYPERKAAITNRYAEQIASHINLSRGRPTLERKTGGNFQLPSDSNKPLSGKQAPARPAMPAPTIESVKGSTTKIATSISQKPAKVLAEKHDNTVPPNVNAPDNKSIKAGALKWEPAVKPNTSGEINKPEINKPSDDTDKNRFRR